MKHKAITNDIIVDDKKEIKIAEYTFAAPQINNENCYILYHENNSDPTYIGWIDDDYDELSETIDDEVLAEVAFESFEDGDMAALTSELEDADDLAEISNLRLAIWERYVKAYKEAAINGSNR